MSINDYYSSLSICSQSFLNQSNFDSCKMKNSLCHQSHVVIGENIEDSYQKFHQASKIVLCRSNRLIFDHHIFLPNQQNLAQISLLKRRYYVSRFLHLIDDTSICDFLNYDKHFRHADKYLLAMTLVYFHRANLREHHFTKDSFYLALWLAHDSVEEDLSAKYGLLPWALQTHNDLPSSDLKNDFKRFLTKKNDLWTRMGFRARVTKEECEQMISFAPSHWIWQRERDDNYHRKIGQYDQQFESEDNRSCSSSLSVSSIEEVNRCSCSRSMLKMTMTILIDDRHPEYKCWTSDDDDDNDLIDEIIRL